VLGTKGRAGSGLVAGEWQGSSGSARRSCCHRGLSVVPWAVLVVARCGKCGGESWQ